ncbi:hypothetical protein M378DRAFT_16332 [Amanita muscaria Koide BX008]|uniref:Uncharacterized protein n=1 Tax=Amanita muscaria (strain Koide BX008) TaxID=946122 RepID=A0A0C2S3T0_AMAMK|nr:hypothetical protein M378DRAFT_16332 [Amanita muscaria Koide BX008]
MSNLPSKTSMRKRTLSKRVADDNNVAEPALKQQRLTLDQHRRNAHPQDDIGDTADEVGSTPGRQSLDRVTDSGSDNAVKESSQPTKLQAVPVVDVDAESTDDESMDILEEFKPKKKGERGERKGGLKVAKVADKESVESQETAEEELARMMKGFNAPVYGFYEPIPAIVKVNGRRCHVFACAAVGCGQKIKRYLDKNDKCSTSNLRSHSKKCWGEEAFEKAHEVKDLAKIREVVGRAKNSPNGNVAAMFACSEGKGIVSYMHRQHTTEEARAVIVKWVAQSMRPFSIVEDPGFCYSLRVRPLFFSVYLSLSLFTLDTSLLGLTAFLFPRTAIAVLPSLYCPLSHCTYI